MIRFINFPVSLFLLFFYHSSVFSQTSTSSPYSRYGLGDLNNPALVQNFSMGGISIGMQNDSLRPFYINPANPASYASSNNTVFEAGLISNTTSLKNDQLKFLTNNTSFGYLSFLIPVTKWWGTSVGLLPYSNVGYNITDSKDLPGVGTIDYQYKGEGGLNQFYWGNGFKFKNISAGFNASYLFGNIQSVRKVIFPDSANAYHYKTSNITNISDITFNYGLQYSVKIDSIKSGQGKKELKEKIRITAGITGGLNSDLRATSDVLSFTYVDDGSAINREGVMDTLENYPGQKGVIALPMSLGYGISIAKGKKWIIGAEYATQKWSDFSFLGEKSNLRNSSRISLGGQLVPATEGKPNYLKRIHYRAGARFVQTPLELKNTQLNEYAISLGAGFPIGREQGISQYSMLNVGVEIGRRGTTDKGLIEEQFVKVIIGITMNDKWFIQPKID